jgi:hypothetical protein
MKVSVRWIKSPRQKFGIPRPPGGHSLIEEELAEKILKIDPKFLEILEKEKPIRVKDTMAQEPRTRPVRREKKD